MYVWQPENTGFLLILGVKEWSVPLRIGVDKKPQVLELSNSMDMINQRKYRKKV